MDLNLFSPERVKLIGLRSADRRSPKPKQSIKTVPRDPITTPTPITSNVITRSTQEIHGQSELVTLAPVDDLGDHMPAFMDEPYQKYCRSQSMPGEVCCSTDLFKFPVAKMIVEIKGCDMLILPEYVADSPYYNPLFFTELDFVAFSQNGSMEHLRDIYLAGGAARGKQFLAALSIAGGFLFGVAVDKVLGFFGYSHSTVEEVKHINANQNHLMQLEKHVEAAEKFARKMKQDAHDVETKEVMIERFLQVSTTLQGVFNHYDILMGTISILFHHRQLSPLLVDRHAVMNEVRAIQLRERNRGNVLLMNVLDVWVSHLSYVVQRNLDIIIMVHLPVGQADSYRHLYEYVKSPLAFSNESTHFFPNPVSKHLLMEKDNTSPRVISEAELAACNSIKDYILFCPGQSFELMSSPPSCLISLHQGDTTGVINECPITLLDESYVYVESLGFGEYSFYSESPVTARVLCGDVAKETVKLDGLKKVKVRRDCRLIVEEFILEPVVDYTVASK